MSYSYRDSHADPNYGERYKRTYTHGYYYEQWVKLEKPILEKILNQLAKNGAESCLDFACGTGRILSLAEEIFSVAHGVDVSESMLKIARENCSSAVIEKVDITKTALGKRFDVITAFRFFLNAEPLLQNEAIAAIHNHLKSDGALIANCHVNKWSPLGIFYRIRNASPFGSRANTMSCRGFKKLFEANSFKVESVYWYSYLPRTGWYFQWIPHILMIPFERFVKNVPIMPKWMAQSFILICKKK